MMYITNFTTTTCSLCEYINIAKINSSHTTQTCGDIIEQPIKI